MKINPEQAANNFLELASEQRLNILLNLEKKQLNITGLADILDATKPEVHRNVTRLIKSGLIEKNNDGSFILTTFGNVILGQIPSLFFISDNKKYFSSHSLGNLQSKFVQRLGALQENQHINGFVKVIEKWTKIHKNANEYIYNILSEVPYSKDITDVISSQLKNNIKIKSIFSENAVIPEDRKKIFQEKDFQKYVVSGLLERKIKKDISVGVLVTDKEAAIFFPNLQGEPDLGEMFVSSNDDFHDWCIDYFDMCWKNSSSFQESKLKE